MLANSFILKNVYDDLSQRDAPNLL